MIKFNDIYALIEQFKVPCVRISDMHGNKLANFLEKNVDITINSIKAMEPYLESYGRVIVEATKDQEKTDPNYRNCFKWIAHFENYQANKTISGAQAVPQQNWMQPPPGYVHQGVMDAKLDAIQAEIKHDRAIRELEKKNEDKFEKYLPYFPALMSGLGFGDDKVEKMMKYTAMSKSNGTISGPTNTLTFKDVDKMTPEEKNKKIQSLLDSLCTKVSAQHMILLLEAIDKNPELAQKAVNFLSM